MKTRIKIFVAALFIGLIVLMNQTAKAETSYPYYIKVNRKQCTVTIYEKDEKGKYSIPVKAMLCSPGYDTPLGTFKTPEKYRWRLLMGDVWGQYCTRINQGVLFHSVWYYEKDPATLSNRQFNNLGTICSHGCVRLNVEDAKWIYDNCPVGTTVKVYDSDNPGPLGKPTAIKVSTATTMGYDPTDVWSSGNPYIDNEPKINGVTNRTAEYGEKINLLKGVTAVSSTSASITDLVKTTIKYQGKKVKKVDTKTTGKYYVTYAVTDPLKKKTSREAVITVVDNTAPKIIGAYNLYLNEEDTLDDETLLEGVSAKWHGNELEEGSVKATLKTVKKTDTLKVYNVVYKATAPNGKTVKKTKKVYVDLEAPVLSGIEDKEITMDTVVDTAFAMENVTLKDNSGLVTIDKVKVTITQESDSVYQVSYVVKDKSYNVTKVKATYTITNFLAFEGITDKTIAKETFMGSYQALQGVKAYNKSSDITNQIQVNISELVDGKYTVTYTIKDDLGHEKTAQAVFTVV